jgi:hypothetical protein
LNVSPLFDGEIRKFNIPTIIEQLALILSEVNLAAATNVGKEVLVF